jgi:hypothetical protein
MKRFVIVGQVKNGEELEKLTKHVSNSLKEFEKEHGQLAETEIQIGVLEEQVQPIYTDARSIGFQADYDFYEEEDE